MQVRLVGRPPLLNAAVATVSVPMLKNASRKRVGPCHAASVEDGGDADALGVHVCGDCQIPTVLSWLELAPSEARLAWLESLPSDRLSTSSIASAPTPDCYPVLRAALVGSDSYDFVA